MRARARLVGEGRGPGSLAYEMALTSSGVFQYSVFTAPRIWDVAAGIVLVKEAGGSVLTYERERKQWKEFSTFRRGEGKGAEPRLRNWNSPIMAGNEELVQYLAKFARHETFIEKVKGVFGGND